MAGGRPTTYKPENAEMLSVVPSAHHFDDVTHRSTGVVVRQWLAGTVRISTLDSVDCVPMQELT